MSVRVVIAEDQQLIRQGLIALFQGEDIDVVGEADHGLAAVDMAVRLKPDIVLMDISMPQCDGVEATRRIKQASPSIRVLVLTVAICERQVAAALAAGADGYALKKLGHDQLMAAIAAVLSGRGYIGPGLDGEAVRAHMDCSASAPLTAREQEVLRMIARGLRNRDIAEALLIAAKTVDTHRTRIMQKLDIHNSAELAAYAIRRGLID